MHKIIFHPDVEYEVEESCEWYENQSFGLGDDFLNELEEPYQTIIELPSTWPKFHKDFRRFLLSKFPFSVIYRSEEEAVYVVAIMHNRRKPGHWIKRT